MTSVQEVFGPNASLGVPVKGLSVRVLGRRGQLLPAGCPGEDVYKRQEEGYLILPVLSDDIAAHLTRFLAENRVGVIRLEERRKRLEDIFRELTGKAASL